MKNRFAAVLASAALALGVGVALAPSASAEITPGNYGKIRNDFLSTGNVSVKFSNGYVKTLLPGQESMDYGTDVDSFYVPGGCTGTIGSASYTGNGTWYGLSNNLNVRTIKIRC